MPSQGPGVRERHRKRTRYSATRAAFLRNLLSLGTTKLTRKQMREAYVEAARETRKRPQDSTFKDELRVFRRAGFLQGDEWRRGAPRSIPPVKRRKGAGRPRKRFRLDLATIAEAVVREEVPRVRSEIGRAVREGRVSYETPSDGPISHWIFVEGEEPTREDVNARLKQLRPDAEDVDSLRHGVGEDWEIGVRELLTLAWLIWGDRATVVLGPAPAIWFRDAMLARLGPIGFLNILADRRGARAASKREIGARLAGYLEGLHKDERERLLGSNPAVRQLVAATKEPAGGNPRRRRKQDVAPDRSNFEHKR
jgi:hypothetical protein